MKIELMEIGADTPGQSNVIRVLTYGASGAGSSVYIQAALHAQEIPGVVAIDALLPKLEAAEQQGKLKGKITLVPHANPLGLAQSVFATNLGRFDMNSRTNFNRAFPKLDGPTPDVAAKSVVEKLKVTLLGLAVEADVVLDLHCDDEGPVYLYAPEPMLANARLLSSALDASTILTYASEGGGTFDEAVYFHWLRATGGMIPAKKLVSTVELRGILDVSDTFAETDANNLYRYLAAVGAIDDASQNLSSREPIVSDEALAELIPTPVSGAVLYCVEVGDKVRAGQCVARIVSEAGMPHHQILAPADGTVITRRERRFLRKGEDVLKILKLAKAAVP